MKSVNQIKILKEFDLKKKIIIICQNTSNNINLSW